MTNLDYLIKHDLLGLPVLASEHGGKVDGLIIYVHALMAVLFVGWLGYFLYAIIRFRKSRSPKADYVGVKGHMSNYLEVGVALVEAILLIGFAVPLWAQIVVAGVLAILLLFLVRPPLLRAFRKGGDPTPSNIDAVLGLTGTVVREFVDHRGQVKLANGETWTARLVDDHDGDLAEGTRVVVQRIDGATAVVAPAPKPAGTAAESGLLFTA